MRRKWKWLSVLTAAVLCLGLMTACGRSDESSTAASKNGITIFNSKMEIQDQMLTMAEQYTEETGVPVEVYYSNDTVSAHLATRYASGRPYTLAMVDAKDIYTLAEDHAVDLSDQKWVKDTDYAISIGDKVYGFPVCIEARGLIYNADAIEKIIGKTFDSRKYRTYQTFQYLLETLRNGGMKYPTGILKEDWSLGAHYLAEVYEQREDPDAFVRALSDGSTKMARDKKYNTLMDTFDLLMEYNYAKASAISAEREVTEQKLAEGEIAFMFGGNWDWSVISAYDHTNNMGIMPVPQDTDDGREMYLVGGGSKYFFIDSSEQTSDEQRQQAKDFLNWLVYKKAGQKFLVEDCSLVPAFSNIKLAVKDPLGASVKRFVDKGRIIPNYNYLPDDHYAILGAQFQKYLAGRADRDSFGRQIEIYWKTKTLEPHED